MGDIKSIMLTFGSPSCFFLTKILFAQKSPSLRFTCNISS